VCVWESDNRHAGEASNSRTCPPHRIPHRSHTPTPTISPNVAPRSRPAATRIYLASCGRVCSMCPRAGSIALTPALPPARTRRRLGIADVADRLPEGVGAGGGRLERPQRRRVAAARGHLQRGKSRLRVAARRGHLALKERRGVSKVPKGFRMVGGRCRLGLMR
jgi:hypothetical protein